MLNLFQGQNTSQISKWTWLGNAVHLRYFMEYQLTLAHIQFQIFCNSIGESLKCQKAMEFISNFHLWTQLSCLLCYLYCLRIYINFFLLHRKFTVFKKDLIDLGLSHPLSRRELSILDNEICRFCRCEAYDSTDNKQKKISINTRNVLDCTEFTWHRGSVS